MSESNSWHDAVKEALQFQSTIISVLHNRVTALEEKVKTLTPSPPPNVITGITGSQYVPLEPKFPNVSKDYK